MIFDPPLSGSTGIASKHHIVFFIFVVSNIGGGLTPIVIRHCFSDI